MAVQKRKKTSDKKNKKKIWFEIIAPKTFKEVSLGNTLAYSLDEIKGRSIKVNLMKVTSNMKNQNVNVTFIINETRDNKGYTELVSYVFVPSSIKRLVRRGKSRVDDSFVCRTKDGKTIRVKSLMITRSITTKAGLIFFAVIGLGAPSLTDNPGRCQGGEIVFYVIMIMVIKTLTF